MISEEILKKIKEKVRAEDPIFKDVEPIISEEKIDVEESKNIEGKLMKIKGIKEERIKKETKEVPGKITTITFRKTVIAEDGAEIPIVRRITVNEKGEIIKDTGN